MIEAWMLRSKNIIKIILDRLVLFSTLFEMTFKHTSMVYNLRDNSFLKVISMLIITKSHMSRKITAIGHKYRSWIGVNLIESHQSSRIEMNIFCSLNGYFLVSHQLKCNEILCLFYHLRTSMILVGYLMVPKWFKIVNTCFGLILIRHETRRLVWIGNPFDEIYNSIWIFTGRF